MCHRGHRCHSLWSFSCSWCCSQALSHPAPSPSKWVTAWCLPPNTTFPVNQKLLTDQWQHTHQGDPVGKKADHHWDAPGKRPMSVGRQRQGSKEVGRKWGKSRGPMAIPAMVNCLLKPREEWKPPRKPCSYSLISCTRPSLSSVPHLAPHFLCH